MEMSFDDLKQQVAELQRELSLQKELIASLRESEDRYKNILENANDLIHTLDCEGRLLYTNICWRETLGYSESEIKNMKIFDIIDPAFQPKCASIFECIMKGEEVEPTETVFITKDGKKIIVEGRCNPKFKNGKAVELMGIFRDITSRKQAEEALRDSESQFRQLTENIQAVFWVGSPDWNTVFYISPAYEKIWGHSCQSLYENPLSWQESILEEDRATIVAAIEQRENIQNFSVVVFPEYRIRRPDNTIRWIFARGFPILNDQGKVIKIAGIAEDVTEKKATEQALQDAYDMLEERVKERTSELTNTHKQLRHSEKLAAIGKLSSCIAHEFNNPICGIQNVIEGIQKHVVLDDDYKNLLGMALSECTRLKNLIRNLQNYNRPSAEKKEQVDLHVLIDEMTLLVKSNFKKNNVTIRKEYSENLPKPFIIPDQIKQVILNLLINAKDASSGKESTVAVMTEFHDHKIKLHFQDNGRGIDPEIIHSIFEPFFTTKPEIKGTGLGLSISDAIIRGHDGEITVVSEPGQGSLFTITLPAPESVNE
jgi:PAS domain S-box-containing protein